MSGPQKVKTCQDILLHDAQKAKWKEEYRQKREYALAKQRCHKCKEAVEIPRKENGPQNRRAKSNVTASAMRPS